MNDRSNQRRLWFALLMLPAFAAAQEGAPAFPPAQVEVVRAEMRELAPVVDVPGSVVSLNDSRLASEVEGVMTWIAQVGDAVEAGAVVARIEPRLMEIAVTRAEAAVARLESDLAFREQQLQRNEGLAASNNASATLLDESRAQHSSALHQLADARAQLQRARGDLERSQIRAPFSGHVVERLASVGEYIAVGEDVVRLVDTGQMEITLQAPIHLSRFVTPGMNVDVRYAERQQAQSVRTVVPVGDAVSRMVEVRLEAASGDYLIGSPVQISLPRDTPVTSVAVPRDALVERGGQSFIYKVGSDDKAEQLVADIRTIVGLWVAIDSGVEVGDRIIVRGAERLGPGQPVNIASER